MRITIDTLVRGAVGTTDKVMTGRVFRTLPRDSVAIIGDDGKQWILYQPEYVDAPRPLNARRGIPARLVR